MNVGNNHVIRFASDKRCGLIVIGQMVLEGNSAIAKEGEISKVVIPSTQGISFRSYTIQTLHFLAILR
jgi:hypothetical protein